MKLEQDQFRVISRERVFTSEKISVAKARLELPNHNEVDWYYTDWPNLVFCAAVEGDSVYMVKEYRVGPGVIITSFVGARNPKSETGTEQPELVRELSEELGIRVTRFEHLFTCYQGTHMSGRVSFYLAEEFIKSEAHPDENELQEIIKLPVKGLYQELLAHHHAVPHTLLMARVLEERFQKQE